MECFLDLSFILNNFKNNKNDTFGIRSNKIYLGSKNTRYDN